MNEERGGRGNGLMRKVEGEKMGEWGKGWERKWVYKERGGRENGLMGKEEGEKMGE